MSEHHNNGVRTSPKAEEEGGGKRSLSEKALITKHLKCLIGSHEAIEGLSKDLCIEISAFEFGIPPQTLRRWLDTDTDLSGVTDSSRKRPREENVSDSSATDDEEDDNDSEEPEAEGRSIPPRRQPLEPELDEWLRTNSLSAYRESLEANGFWMMDMLTAWLPFNNDVADGLMMKLFGDNEYLWYVIRRKLDPTYQLNER